MSATLLTNAKIYSRTLPPPEALLIEGERIAWLGTAEQASAFTHLPTIDCQGAWLAPAFADSHVHATNTGLELTAMNLKHCFTADMLAAEVLRRGSQVTGVVIGHGWDDTDWPAPPSSEMIDIHNPAYLSRVDVHSALINQSLIDLCPGIELLDGWNSDGVVSRAAHGLARSTAFSLLSESQRDTARTAFVQHALSLGIVAVDEMSGPVVASADDARRVVDIAGENLQIYLWWGELFGTETAQALNAYGCGGDLFIDGSLGSKTAFLRQPYVNGGLGTRYISLEEVQTHIDMCIASQLPTGFHAIGDAATHIATAGFAHAAAKWGKEAIVFGNHRIEHAELMEDSQRRLCREFGIALSMQPQFDELWAGPSGMYEQRLGSRYTALNDFAAATKQGVSVLLGSDAPVTDLNPWRSIDAAVNTHNPSHALSVASAFTAHTRAFWRNHGVPDCGFIEVGALASLALWQVNLMSELAAKPIGRSWSTDPRSGHQPLPDLSAGYPRCVRLWNRGRLVFEGAGL